MFQRNSSALSVSIFSGAFLVIAHGCVKAKYNKGSRENQDAGISSAVSRQRVSNASQALDLAKDPSVDGKLFAIQNPYNFKMVAKLSPPLLQGIRLEASNIVVHDNTVFVGYRSDIRGLEGGIDVLQFEPRKETLELVSDATYSDRTVNDMDVRGNELFFAGEMALKGKFQAYVVKMQLQRGALLSTATAMAKVEGDSATGVLAKRARIYVTSGEKGALTVLLRKDLSEQLKVPLESASAVDGKRVGRYVAVGVSNPPSFQIFNNDGKLLRQASFNGATQPTTKADLQFGRSHSLIAVGEEGLKSVCNNDGVIVGEITSRTLGQNGAFKALAVASWGRLVFVATGGSKVEVYRAQNTKASLTTLCSGVSFSKLASLEFDDKKEVTGLFARKNFLFASTGEGGLKIVKLDKKPDAVADDFRDFDPEDNEGDDVEPTDSE